MLLLVSLQVLTALWDTGAKLIKREYISLFVRSSVNNVGNGSVSQKENIPLKHSFITVNVINVQSTLGLHQHLPAESETSVK